MKDVMDKSTPDLEVDQVQKRPPGRPRKWAADADRQRAYRERKQAQGYRVGWVKIEPEEVPAARPRMR